MSTVIVTATQSSIYKCTNLSTQYFFSLVVLLIIPSVSGIKLSTGDNGSHPGKRTNIIGFTEEESAKHWVMSNSGT